ncbi:MAG: prephenate dehydrogenase [Candidatus Omnitrophota bacterium]
MVLGSKQLFRKVTIIGVGLMGGSLGKAIKKQGLAREVAGLSRKAASLSAAQKAGAIDMGTHDIKKAVANADLVVLATPVSVVPKMFEMIAPHIRRNTIVTDVGSTKVSIVRAAGETLPNASYFVGSHPLAGSEKRGAEHADENLYRGAVCIMTPAEGANRQAVDRVKKLWSRVGSQVKILPPEEHDEVLAAVSHVPHLLAYALMRYMPQNYLPFAAGGLKDTTRIAASSPQVWSDISLANSRNILKSLDAVIEELSHLRRGIIEKDDKALMQIFKTAQAKRNRIK